MRERILAAAGELGYVGPDPAARALARGTTGAVGVLLTDSLPYAFTDVVATRFLGAVADELAPTGLALTLLTSDERTDGIIPARDVAIDGALVYSCRKESAARDWLIRRKLPLVFVDQGEEPGIDSVNVDDRGGARAAAQHLVDAGHRRVGILTAVVDRPAGVVEDPLANAEGHPQRERIRGWLDALTPAGVIPTVVQVRTNRDDEARAMARLLLGGDDRPTAVLCFSDVLALGVIGEADELGLRVPADLSVVGFDDTPAAASARPGLTTVHQDVGAKGRLAAAALAAVIERSRSDSKRRARHNVLPTELIIRDSTGPAPH